MKVCTRCKKDLDDSCFRKRRDTYKDSVYFSLNPTCRKCDSEITKIYYANKKDIPEFKNKNRERVKKHRQDNWEIEKIKAKNRRQTPEYKEMMRNYRKKNKEKIYQQEAIGKRKYYEKNRDGLTDIYIIGLYRTQGLADEETLKKHPELIEAKRLQILLTRKIKTKCRLTQCPI